MKIEKTGGTGMKNFRWDKKYLYWGMTAFTVIAACLMFYMILQNVRWFQRTLTVIMYVLSPFVWGFAIAYLLTPMVKTFQRYVFGPLSSKIFRNGEKKRRRRVFARAMSVLLAEIMLLAIIAVLLNMILPQLYSSIRSIVINSPYYARTIINWVENLLSGWPEIEELVVSLVGNVPAALRNWAGSWLPQLDSLLNNLTSGAYQLVRGVFNIFIGFIVSIYALYNKEYFIVAGKKVLYAVFKDKTAGAVLQSVDFVNDVFMNFIAGKILDSAIIGVLCYIGCAILKMPYTILVSVVVGVTNLIPFFGPFIGAIPSALIILMVSPVKALIFIIFILLLQQFDGNVLGPKILGGTTGINGFWVMFAIILGAGLYGFAGMLLGVPVFVVLYAGVRYLVDNALRRRGLPTEGSAELYRPGSGPGGGAPPPEDEKMPPSENP